jgi:hypothetical protein
LLARNALFAAFAAIHAGKLLDGARLTRETVGKEPSGSKWFKVKELEAEDF